MNVLRIYLENSAIGGYFDDEFAEPTQKLFDMFLDGIYKPVISVHVIDELSKGAPEQVVNNLHTLDFLVSWNCKHIVNLNKIRLFNSINIREGYNTLEIRTLEEVV